MKLFIKIDKDYTMYDLKKAAASFSFLGHTLLSFCENYNEYDFLETSKSYGNCMLQVYLTKKTEMVPFRSKKFKLEKPKKGCFEDCDRFIIFTKKEKVAKKYSKTAKKFGKPILIIHQDLNLDEIILSLVGFTMDLNLTLDKVTSLYQK